MDGAGRPTGDAVCADFRSSKPRNTHEETFDRRSGPCRLPAFATTYSYADVAKSLINSAGASFAVSIDDSTELLTATVTSAFDRGLSVQCCSPLSTYPVTSNWPTSTGHAPGTYSHSLVLSQASSWDASLLAGNGSSTSSAFSALMTGLNNGIGGVAAWTTASSNYTGRLVAAPLPEPGTYALMALGLGLMAFGRRQRGA